MISFTYRQLIYKINTMENKIIDSGSIKILIDKEVNANENHSQSLVKKKRGRPPYLVTADTKKKVFDLSIVGTRYEDIALVLGISDDTLVKYYKPELEKGRIEANAAVAGTLFEKAKQGDTSSMIFC